MHVQLNLVSQLSIDQSANTIDDTVEIYIPQLPLDIIKHIFSYLNYRRDYSLRRVCKYWNQAALEMHLAAILDGHQWNCLFRENRKDSNIIKQLLKLKSATFSVLHAANIIENKFHDDYSPINIRLILNQPCFQFPLALKNYSNFACEQHLDLVIDILLLDNKIEPSIDDNFLIRQASKLGCVNIVKTLLDDKRVDPAAMKHKALFNAITYSHHKIVCLLLNDNRINFEIIHQQTLVWDLAIRGGSTEVIKVLLEHSSIDPSFNNQLPIENASFHGKLEIITLLLKDPRVNPSLNNQKSLCLAAANGHLEVIKQLLQDPRVDVSANHHEAIRLASQFRHEKVVLLLTEYMKK